MMSNAAVSPPAARSIKRSSLGSPGFIIEMVNGPLKEFLHRIVENPFRPCPVPALTPSAERQFNHLFVGDIHIRNGDVLLDLP